MAAQVQSELFRILASIVMFGVASVLWQFAFAGSFRDIVTLCLFVFACAAGGFAFGLLNHRPKTFALAGATLGAFCAGFLILQSGTVVDLGNHLAAN